MTVAHSTVPFLPVTPAIPADYLEAACRGCHTALLVPANDDAMPLCRSCRKSAQESEAIGICQSIRALAAGGDGFDLLSEDERRVHLSQIATVVEHARRVTLAVEPVTVSPTVQAIVLAHYESTAADEPSEDERQAIYAMEEILDREETVAGEYR